ncbi:MAG: hypothetical protein AAFN59_07740 [Pseudomonadota bacterium]
MTLLRVSVTGTKAMPVGPSDLPTALDAAFAALPPGAPIVLMIHGYKFSPRSYRHTPHRHILSIRTSKRAPRLISWPRHMRMAQTPQNGLAIAFGWEARGTLWRAHGRALQAAQALADLMNQIRARRYGAIDIMAHSLGARVALGAMERVDAHSIGRLILMSGAVFGSDAERALATPAGKTAEVINTTTRENAVFDAMFAGLVRPLAIWDAPISSGLARPKRNWLDVAIDDPSTCSALAQLGFPIAAPRTRICHWSGYLRPGLFALYRALLHQRDDWPLERLRDAFPIKPAAITSGKANRQRPARWTTLGSTLGSRAAP